MKQIVIALGTLAALGYNYQAQAQAQKYFVIDSKYILEKLPEYTDAQKKLDDASKLWQEEIDKKMQQVDQMYKAYQAERAMLSEEARKKREDEIIAKEKDAKDLQKKYFGFDGELYKKRQDLVKPVQDKVFNSVQQYAQSRGFELVYDKAGGVTIFYADPKLDKSDEIVKIITKK
jgi:outer membrane protein